MLSASTRDDSGDCIVGGRHGGASAIVDGAFKSIFSKMKKFLIQFHKMRQ